MLFIVHAEIKQRSTTDRKTVSNRIAKLVNAVDEADAILTLNNFYGVKDINGLNHKVRILSIFPTLESPNLNSDDDNTIDPVKGDGSSNSAASSNDNTVSPDKGDDSSITTPTPTPADGNVSVDTVPEVTPEDVINPDKVNDATADPNTTVVDTVSEVTPEETTPTEDTTADPTSTEETQSKELGD
jgi:hypothetical protein